MTRLPERYRNAVTFSFGDTPELKDELLALVLEGRKTATCGTFRNFGSDGEPMPVPGRRDVVLDSNGRPAAVVETIEVTMRRFGEVDDEFAAAEGEGDCSLAGWRQVHEVYFARNGGFSPDMELVCERFRLIEVLER